MAIRAYHCEEPATNPQECSEINCSTAWMASKHPQMLLAPTLINHWPSMPMPVGFRHLIMMVETNLTFTVPVSETVSRPGAYDNDTSGLVTIWQPRIYLHACLH